MADYQYASIVLGKGFNPLDPLNLFGRPRDAAPQTSEPGPVSKIADALKSLSIVGGVVLVVAIVGIVYFVAKTTSANVRAGGDVLGRLGR